MVEQPRGRQRSPAAPGVTLSELRILVVEDHPFQRSVIAEALRTLGVTHVASAADGDAALALLREARPAMDIAIVDLGLPGMDGAELIRRIAEQRLARALILWSAARHAVQEQAAAAARARGLRVLGHLDKPMSVRNLQGLLELVRPDLPPAA